MLPKILVAIFILLPSVTFGATTYETAPAISSVIVDFPSSGSNATSTPVYGYYYELPLGIQFDRIQMSVPSSQGNYTRITEMYLGSITGGNEPWNCPNSNCLNGNFSAISLSVNSATLPLAGTQQYVFSTTTTVTTNNVFGFYFDPNTPYLDISFNGTANQLNAYGVNGGNYSRSQVVPTLKFCNGTCDSDTFSPTPTASASPWARMISPANNSIVIDDIALQFQVNTGTTTADNAVVRFSSQLQSFAPYTYDLTQTGINSFSYDFNVPSFNDYVQVVIELFSGTTSVAISPTYALNIGDSFIVPILSEEEVTSCDTVSGLTWAICKVAVLLFVPSNNSIDKFTSLTSDLETKFPFIYAYQFSESVDNLYSGTSTATSSISYDFAGLGTLTLISVEQLEAVPFQSWLRTVIGMLLWIMFAVLMYNRTLRIFNTNPQ